MLAFAWLVPILLGFYQISCLLCPEDWFFIWYVLAALKHVVGISVRMLQINGACQAYAPKQHLWEPALPAIMHPCLVGSVLLCVEFCRWHRPVEVLADNRAIMFP